MAILVTGGAGYIGSHTVFELINHGRRVVVLDNLTTGHRAAVHPEAVFYEGDVRDGAFLGKVFTENNIDAVVHFAASSQVAESVREPLLYYNNNLGGAVSLLTSMQRHGVSRLVFSSTAAVYGEPSRVPIEEADPTLPTNPYGETKLAMEGLIRSVCRAGGPAYVSLRYFNAAGAKADGAIGEDHDPETHLIPIVLSAAAGRRPGVTVFGDDYPTPDGTCVRDYIHVTDLATAHIRALEYLEKGGESAVFNLGNGNGFSVREVIETARAVTGRPIPSVAAPRRPGDPARLVASNDRARKGLGFTPAIPGLAEIIASAWKWHSTHPAGYRGL